MMDRSIILSMYSLQLILGIGLALVLSSFYKRYQKSYLLQWSWSWWFLSIYMGSAGLALFMSGVFSPAYPLRVIISSVAILAALLQVVYLIFGAYELTGSQALHQRRQRTIIMICAVVSIALSLFYIDDAHHAIERLFVRVGLRCLVLGIALLFSGYWVLVKQGIKNSTGRKLTGIMLVCSGLQQEQYFVSILLRLLNVIEIPYFYFLGILDILMQFAIGIGIVLWLLDEEHLKAITVVADSEERYRIVAETATDGIVTIDASSKILFVNSTMARIFGYTREELRGMSLTRLMPESLRNVHLQSLHEYLATGKKHMSWEAIQLQGLRKDGSEILLEISYGEYVKDGDHLFTGIIRDITERRKAEQELKETEERFSKAFYASPFAMTISRLDDGRYIDVNDSFLHLVGYSREEIIGHNSAELHMWIDSNGRRKIVDALKNSNSLRNLETKFRSKSGTIQTWRSSLEIIVIGGEEHILSLIEDITHRTNAEQALKESEERYRSLFDRMMDGVYRSTHEGKFVDVNSAMVRMFGFASKEEMLSVDIKKDLYFAPDERDSLFLDTGLEKVEVFRMRRKDGSEIWVEDHGQYVHDNQGNVLFHEGILRDVTERIQTEVTLKEQQSFVKKIMDLNPNFIFAKDRQGRFTLANKAVAEAYGTTPENLVGKSDADFNPNAEEVAFFQRMDNEVIASQKKKFIPEEKITDASGKVRWLQTVKIPIIGERGQSDQVLGVATDITEQKQMHQLQGVLYRIVEATVTTSTLSDLYKAVHEIIKEIMVAENFYISLYDEQKDILHFPYFVDKIDPQFGSKKPGRGFTEYVLRTGHSLLCDIKKTDELIRLGEAEMVGAPSPIWLGIPLKIENKIIGVMVLQDYENEKAYTMKELGVLEFVSNEVAKAIYRKRTEEELEQSEDRYRQFFEDDLAAVYISTVSGTLLECNPAFLRVFGFDSLDEAMKTNMAELYPSVEMRLALVPLLMKERRLEYYEMELRSREGKPIYVVANIVGVFDDQGNLKQMKGYFFDDTKRRLLEQQFIQSQKMESLGTLAGGIAHDFNNILGIILGHTSLIKGVKYEPMKTQQSIDVIRKTTERAASLVRQLLTFARKGDVNLESARVNEAIIEIIKLLHETFPKTITISTDLQQNLPSIVADVTQLHQVLLNLCVNARDAMPNGGSLSLSSRLVPYEMVQSQFPNAIAVQHVEINIADTGTGMDEATKKRIFEPFFTTKEKGKGTGLGLAVVFGIIENHDGYIAVDSGVGQGTKFRLYFPVQSTADLLETTKDRDSAEAPEGTETILLVEDEELMRMLAQSMIARKGYTVLAAEDGEEGLALYREHQSEIALVVSDLGMPRLGGNEMFLEMKKINENVKAIFVSGYLNPELKSEMLKSGARDFLLKPYRAEELLWHIREVLDRT